MDLTWLSAILVGAGCLALGYLIGTRYPARFLVSATLAKDTAVVGDVNKKNQLQKLDEIEKLADILEDFKMVHYLSGCLSITLILKAKLKLFSFLLFLQVLVVRNDLKMGKGKIAAQCR